MDIPLSPEVDPAAAIADTARIAEGLLGVPFPNNEIILIVTPPASVYIDLAAYYGSFMVLWRARGGTEVPFIPHETAHYYFTGGLGPHLARRRRGGVHRGVHERSARHREPRRTEAQKPRGGSGETASARECGTFESSMSAYASRTPVSDANYSLGEFFLTNLFEMLGEEAFGAAIGDLYLLSRSERRRVTEEEIYQAFLEHTPAKRIRGFRYLYERWHGGSFLDEQD